MVFQRAGNCADLVAQRLKAGERLRIAISEGLWPLVWPSPDSPTLTLDPSASTLSLPVRTPPLVAPVVPIASVTIAPDKGDVVVTTTDDHGRLSVAGTWPDKARTCANGTILSGYGPNTVATITTGAPNSGSWSGTRVSRYRRGDWNCELRIGFTVTSTAHVFKVSEALSAYKDGVEIFRRETTDAVMRDLL